MINDLIIRSIFSINMKVMISSYYKKKDEDKIKLYYFIINRS